MGHEIEHRFLVRNEGWRKRAGKGAPIRQGYVAIGELASVRVRIKGGSKATLTIKSRTSGLRRSEFEYVIPAKDAAPLMALCPGTIIEKVRYRVPYRGVTWEVDVFEGRNTGLVIAEIELRDEQEQFHSPQWLGEEITSEDRYRNASLSLHPFCGW